MNDMLESIRRTKDALDALRDFLESLPPTEAVKWDNSGPHQRVDPGLVQLFPADNKMYGKMRASASAIAKRWGGEWREYEEGSWEGVRPDGTKMILYWVEPVPPPGNLITFDEPAEEPEPMLRDEPDYDAPRPLTAMENWQRNDEHHVR